MTTLVTGHGLVGARLVEQIALRGDEVVVYDLAPPPARPGVVPVAGQLLDLASVVETVRRHRPERIIHTAGLLTPAGRDRPYETAQVNVGGTLNVLEAARLAGTPRVVFTSSVVVYDAAVAARQVSEQHPCEPRTVYAATKRAGEILGREYARLAGLTFLAMRFAAVYGPATAPGGGVSRVVHDALSDALATGRATVRRRWPGRQDLLYADDAAAALVAAAWATAPVHDVFNVGSGELVSAEDVAAAIADLTGAAVTVVDPPDHGDGANPHVVEAPLDLRRAAAELGWRPTYDLRRGLAAQLTALRGSSAAG